MANGYAPKEIKSKTVSAIGASVSNSPISDQFPIYAGGAMRGMVIKINVSGVTVGAGITAKLQTAIDGEFEDSKTVAVTANGNVYIKLLAAAAADQTYLPLLSTGRVVITTGAGSAVTIDSMQILQDL